MQQETRKITIAVAKIAQTEKKKFEQHSVISMKKFNAVFLKK